jgi:hypothetical protein
MISEIAGDRSGLWPSAKWPQARIADSSSRKAVSFSSARTTKRFPSLRCASDSSGDEARCLLTRVLLFCHGLQNCSIVMRHVNVQPEIASELSDRRTIDADIETRLYEEVQLPSDRYPVHGVIPFGQKNRKDAWLRPQQWCARAESRLKLRIERCSSEVRTVFHYAL